MPRRLRLAAQQLAVLLGSGEIPRRCQPDGSRKRRRLALVDARRTIGHSQCWDAKSRDWFHIVGIVGLSVDHADLLF